jgi:hypothetical protein
VIALDTIRDPSIQNGSRRSRNYPPSRPPDSAICSATDTLDLPTNIRSSKIVYVFYAPFLISFYTDNPSFCFTFNNCDNNVISFRPTHPQHNFQPMLLYASLCRLPKGKDMYTSAGMSSEHTYGPRSVSGFVSSRQQPSQDTRQSEDRESAARKTGRTTPRERKPEFRLDRYQRDSGRYGGYNHP